jgi:hypothetical protein
VSSRHPSLAEVIEESVHGDSYITEGLRWRGGGSRRAATER